MGNEPSAEEAGSARPEPRGGGLVAPQRRMLEVKLSQPNLDQLLGNRPKPRAIFARLSSAQYGEVVEAPWEKAVQIKLASDDDSVVVSMFGADSAEAYARGEMQLISEVLWPYKGQGGLADLGVAPHNNFVDVNMALGQSTPQDAQGNQPGLSARARELQPPPLTPMTRPSLSPGSSPGFGTAVAPPGRQLVKLELENAVLRAKTGIQDDPARVSSKTVKHLRALEQENFEIEAQIGSIQSKVERNKAALAGQGQSGPRVASTQDWGRSLNVMRKEHELCQKRGIEIRRNHDERAKVMNMQLAQFHHEVKLLQAQSQSAIGSSNSAAESLQRQVLESQRRVEEVSLNRNKLLGQLREMTTKGDVPTAENAEASLPEVQQLNADIERSQHELEDLKKEVNLRHAREHGSIRCQEMSSEVMRLREEIEESQCQRNDEKFRMESEVRELKIECGKAKDALENASTELQFLSEKTKALRSVNVAPGASNQQSITELAKLKLETTEHQQELELLKQIEQTRIQTIQDLNKDLEQLEEQALRAFECRTTQPAPAPSRGGSIDVAAQLKAMEEERQALDAEELKLQATLR